MDPTLEQLLASLGFFKDWTNYLLVTTVAALGWVATKEVRIKGGALRVTIALLCASIVFAIFTLATIPLVGQAVRAGSSIYDVEPTFRLFWMWGPEVTTKLKWVCWPQHICFLAAIITFSVASIREVKH